MAAVASIALGFVLTTIAGGWWASRLQQRAWERQNTLQLQEQDIRRASEVCDELTRLLDKRLYRMRRLYWAVAGLDHSHASAELLQSRLDDYNDVLYEWNDRLNANLALLGSNFGTAARDYLFDLYEDFRRVGRELEAVVVSARHGEDVSAALPSVDSAFQGWSPGSLNGRVYTLGLAMTTQLRDGLVGRSAPGREASPDLQPTRRNR